ncbi:hypothetical protein [Pseudomonas sp. S1(2024)]|uniref:hypothetical protein n=1 Tax=Pseudomonas sp. S1(2024) TaxID=3390191 RepID=UPI0039796557
MAKVKVSLAAAHILTSHLMRELSNQNTLVTRAMCPMTVHTADNVSTKVGLAKDAFLQQLRVSHLLYDSVGIIREAIGVKNGEIGLQALLSKRKALEAKRDFLKDLIDSVSYHDSAIEAALVGNAFDRLINSERLPAINVQVIEQEELDQLNQDVRDLTKQADRLGREISELNSYHKIEVELDDGVAELLSL